MDGSGKRYYAWSSAEEEGTHNTAPNLRKSTREEFEDGFKRDVEARVRKAVKAIPQEMIEEEMSEHQKAGYRELTSTREGERNGYYRCNLITPPGDNCIVEQEATHQSFHTEILVQNNLASAFCFTPLGLNPTTCKRSSQAAIILQQRPHVMQEKIRKRWYSLLKAGRNNPDRKSGHTSNFGHETVVRGSLSPAPLVSILISNYNYQRFLSEAVNSALNQTYPYVEVVVVDDGSTDDSSEIIASYGDQIVAVLKENAGQASACNAGFLTSKGEIVIFLDADDVLLPDTVERVVAAFQSRPGVAKVHYMQQIIDESGSPTGEFQPARITLQEGDLRQRLVELNEYNWPSTSGNAFAATVLRQIMPIPEALYRGIPDIYLCNLSAVFGEVVSLEEPGSLYRIHGGNNFFDAVGVVNPEKLRSLLLAVEDNYMRQKSLFAALYSVNTHLIGSRNLWFLRARMMSLSLDPQNHPFKEDTRTKLFLRGCALAASVPDFSMSRRRRVLYLLWFVTMFTNFRPVVMYLARRMWFTERKSRLHRILMSLT